MGKTGRLGALLWHSRWQTRRHCFPQPSHQSIQREPEGLVACTGLWSDLGQSICPRKNQRRWRYGPLPKANPSDSVIKLSFTPLTTMRMPKLRKGLLSIPRHRHTQPRSCPHTLATPRITSPRKSNPAFLDHEICLCVMRFSATFRLRMRFIK